MKPDLIPTDDLVPHPLLQRMPMMAREDLEALTEDIRQHGIRDALHAVPDTDGSPLVVDGRHRLRAAQDAGLEKVPVIMAEQDEAAAIIISQIVHRRHYPTKGALAYVVYPVLHRMTHRKRGNPSLQNSNADSIGICSVSTICVQIGIGKDLWEQAGKVHRIFADDNDYREKMEPRILRDGVGLGAVIAGHHMPGLAQKGVEGRKDHAGIVAARFADMDGIFASRWEKMREADRGAVAKMVGNTVSGWPEMVQEEIRIALGGARPKSGRRS